MSRQGLVREGRESLSEQIQIGQLHGSGRNQMETISRRSLGSGGLAGSNGSVAGGEGQRAALGVLPAKTHFPVDGVDASAHSMGDGGEEGV